MIQRAEGLFGRLRQDTDVKECGASGFEDMMAPLLYCKIRS